MVFFVLACQCMSTLAIVRRETRSWRWPVFMFGYMTVLAWLAAFVVYQGRSALGVRLMFSEQGLVQEVITLVIALLALSYVVHKLTGWPRKRPQSPKVEVGERLARGLQKTLVKPGPPQ